MFFSDLGDRSNSRYPTKIERAYMDGSRRFVLVSDKLVAPVGITVDLVGQRVYWSDSHMDHIETIDYFGQNRYFWQTSRCLAGKKLSQVGVRDL